VKPILGQKTYLRDPRSVNIYTSVNNLLSSLTANPKMGGQRHSKNAGTMGVEGLTYHEKKALGFGTVKQRLGKVWLACLVLSMQHSAAFASNNYCRPCNIFDSMLVHLHHC